jgi:hypothetical protein
MQPDDAAPAMRLKFDREPERVTVADDAPRPDWIFATQIIKATADVPRGRAPGPDSWTRELLLTSFTKQTMPLWELAVNGLARCDLHPTILQMFRASRLAAWRKKGSTSAPGAAPGARVIGMTSHVTKVAWKIVLAQHLRSRHFPPWLASFCKAPSRNQNHYQRQQPLA